MNVPVLVLTGLRRRYPQVRIRWDDHLDRTVVAPVEVAKQTPGLLDDLVVAKPVILDLLKWEERHGAISVTQREEELLAWLYQQARPDLWPGTIRLRPWTSEVRASSVLDGLRVEAALGPASPSWRRVLEDLETLRALDLSGAL